MDAESTVLHDHMPAIVGADARRVKSTQRILFTGIR